MPLEVGPQYADEELYQDVVQMVSQAEIVLSLRRIHRQKREAEVSDAQKRENQSLLARLVVEKPIVM